MAQTAAEFHKELGNLDYTPASAVTAGDVVVINGIVGIAPYAIAANAPGVLVTRGRVKLPKLTGAQVAGLPVHWNPTGTPVTGDASSGSCNQAGVGTYAGVACDSPASGDSYTIVDLNAPTNLMAVTTVAAAGSVIGDAAQLSQGINVVTGADGTKGVILPVAVPGMQVIVKGTASAVLKVWPKTGAAINALSASAALSMTTGAMPLTFVATSATQWYTLPLVAS